MSYNYSKAWLDEQVETMQSLVEIARTGGVSRVELPDMEEAIRYQFYISNVKHGMQLHYPHYADVSLSIRTWIDKNYEAGIFTVNVGIASPANYNRQRRGRSQRTRRLPPPTVQGRPPIALRAGLSPAPAYGKQWTETTTIEADDTNTIDVPMENTEFVLAMVSGAETTTTKQLIFKVTKLTTQAIQVMMEQIPHWTVEDSTVDDQGMVTTLTLRRMEVAQ